MNFHRKVFDNGLRLVTIPMKDTATVTVMVLVETGSKYEDARISGMAHFLEHMCFKGTKKRPNAHILSTELDSIGADYNAFTSHEYTGYYIRSHAKHADKILDIISDLYQNQTLDETELEKEKGVIVEEIKMYEDIPQEKVRDLIYEALYKDQPAGRSIAGTKESVLSITRKDMFDYMKKHYTSKNTAVIVAGNYDENTIEDKIKTHFSSLPNTSKIEKEKTIDTQDGLEIKIIEKKTDQTHFVLAVRSYNAYDKRNYALKLLSGILGGGMSSRLFQLLREKMGVCYYVGTSNNYFTDHGFFEISAGIDTTRIDEVFKAIMNEISKIINEEIPEEELNKVKDCILGHTALSLESSKSWARYFGSQEILNKELKRPEERAELLQKVTAKDIQDVARDIFRIDNMTLAMVSTYNNAENIRSLLKLS